MTSNKTKATRVVVPVSIAASVDKVFRLAGPVEEYWWIPGWKCQLVHCPNDRVEQGTVFREISTAPILMGLPQGATTWTVILRDEKQHRVHFQLENRFSRSLYQIELQHDGPAGTRGTLDFSYKPKNCWGRKLMRNNLDDKIRLMLSVIHAMLKTYSETNKMISRSVIQGMITQQPSLTITDKVHLGLNEIAKSLMKDRDRARFIQRSGHHLGKSISALIG